MQGRIDIIKLLNASEGNRHALNDSRFLRTRCTDLKGSSRVRIRQIRGIGKNALACIRSIPEKLLNIDTVLNASVSFGHDRIHCGTGSGKSYREVGYIDTLLCQRIARGIRCDVDQRLLGLIGVPQIALVINGRQKRSGRSRSRICRCSNCRLCCSCRWCGSWRRHNVVLQCEYASTSRIHLSQICIDKNSKWSGGGNEVELIRCIKGNCVSVIERSYSKLSSS